MKKRLLFGRVTGERGDVILRHHQAAHFVEAHLADASLALSNQAAMAAGIAA
jgi:hypothetical protein